MISSGLISSVALLAWPLIAALLFSRMQVAQAALLTVLGALLLLPSGVQIKLPMVPSIDKTSISNISAFIGCSLLAPRRKRGGWTDIIIVVLVLSPILTSFANGDPVRSGLVLLPAVGLYDGISASLSQLLAVLSFVVAQKCFRNSEDMQFLLRSLVVAAALYSIPMFFEVRFSPQLAEWIYGFRPSAFVVEYRYGGYRPVVFMQNGLAASFFVATALIAAFALRQAKINVLRGRSDDLIRALLVILIVMCKSGGALVYSLIFGPLVRWLSARNQMRIAIILVSISLSYPLARYFDLFPTNKLVELASYLDEDRASSLGFRFDQEQQLLRHAGERMLFGWGRFGRNRVYSDYSTDDTSVTDGQWIITLGQFGLIGYLAQFGLLAIPVFRAASALKVVSSKREQIVLSATAVILGTTLIEQLPNASVNGWTWFLAGALMGLAQGLVSAPSTQRSANKLGSSLGRSIATR